MKTPWPLYTLQAVPTRPNTTSSMDALARKLRKARTTPRASAACKAPGTRRGRRTRHQPEVPAFRAGACLSDFEPPAGPSQREEAPALPRSMYTGLLGVPYVRQIPPNKEDMFKYLRAANAQNYRGLGVMSGPVGSNGNHRSTKAAQGPPSPTNQQCSVQSRCVTLPVSYPHPMQGRYVFLVTLIPAHGMQSTRWALPRTSPPFIAVCASGDE